MGSNPKQSPGHILKTLVPMKFFTKSQSFKTSVCCVVAAKMYSSL